MSDSPTPPSEPPANQPPPPAQPPQPAGPVQPSGAGSASPYTKEERNYAMLCHLTSLVGFVLPIIGNIVPPLVLWLIKREESAFIDDQGKESVNFQITLSFGLMVALLLSIVLIGIPILFALWIAQLILVIIAAVRSQEGTAYRYPATLRLIS